MRAPGNKRDELRSKCSTEPCGSRRRLRPAESLLRQALRTCTRVKVEVTRLFHHWTSCADAVPRLRRKRIPVRESPGWQMGSRTPILADMPEVATQCATDRRVAGGMNEI